MALIVTVWNEYKRFRICERYDLSSLIRAKCQQRSITDDWIRFSCDSIEAFIKIFRFFGGGGGGDANCQGRGKFKTP